MRGRGPKPVTPQPAPRHMPHSGGKAGMARYPSKMGYMNSHRSSGDITPVTPNNPPGKGGSMGTYKHTGSSY